MNLRKAAKILQKVFDEYDLDFEIKVEDKRVRATNSLSLKGYDDDVFADFSFYESGASQYRFVFDKLQKDSNTLRLVNDFNENVVWFKAYIDDKYLVLQHVVEYLDEDILPTYTRAVLNDLVDDDMRDYLVPLTNLTTD